MPRPLLHKPQQIREETDHPLSLTQKPVYKQQTQLEKMKLDRLLRKKRSPAYMEALRNLDAGGHVHNQQQVKEIMDAIRQEFPEVEITGILLGHVAACYLGAPYEVHVLDMAGGGIIEHDKAGHPLPGGLEKARNIAMRGGYAFIEVYVDCCRAIKDDGSVAVISC